MTPQTRRQRERAEREQLIGIRQQQAQQQVFREAQTTATAEMAVRQVNVVREAESTRDAQVVAAEQARQITVIAAEALREKQITEATGMLEQQKKVAEARRVNGEAEGAAQQAVLMAPVNSQIALAKEIGENHEYQVYLIRLKEIEAGQTVGSAAAAALEKAGVKIIATTGSPMDGVKSVMDLMTPKGATQLGASLEALAQTPLGERVAAYFQKNGVASAEP